MIINGSKEIESKLIYVEEEMYYHLRDFENSEMLLVYPNQIENDKKLLEEILINY